jgi:hypothetical protein
MCVRGEERSKKAPKNQLPRKGSNFQPPDELQKLVTVRRASQLRHGGLFDGKCKTLLQNNVNQFQRFESVWVAEPQLLMGKEAECVWGVSNVATTNEAEITPKKQVGVFTGIFLPVSEFVLVSTQASPINAKHQVRTSGAVILGFFSFFLLRIGCNPIG